MKRETASCQLLRIALARRLPVNCRWRATRSRTTCKSFSSSKGSRSTESRLQRFSVKSPRSSKHVCEPAAHACSEVPPARTENYYQSIRHVFTAMVPDALNDRGGSGIANRKTFASDTVKEGFAARRAIERDIADDDIFLRCEPGTARRMDNDSAARKALADIVIRFAFQGQRDPLRKEGTRDSARPSRRVECGWCLRAVPRTRNVERSRR